MIKGVTRAMHAVASGCRRVYDIIVERVTSIDSRSSTLMCPNHGDLLFVQSNQPRSCRTPPGSELWRSQ